MREVYRALFENFSGKIYDVLLRGSITCDGENCSAVAETVTGDAVFKRVFTDAFTVIEMKDGTLWNALTNGAGEM